MITEEQRKERLLYLGGSDSAAVLGLSRWKTPLEVWAEKTGQIIPEDISDKLPVKLGNRLEQVVADLFTEETGFKVRRVNETLYHPGYPFLAANIDRRVVGTNEIVELKTASGWKAREWAGEDVPGEYVAQCMHYLAVTGAKRAYLAVLIGGNQDFVVKVIERDEVLISEMTKKLTHFWRTYVETKTMPMMIQAGDTDTLFKLFPDAEGELVLGDDVDALASSRQSMLQDLKSLERQLEQMENQIKARLTTAAQATTSNFKISWKPQTTNRLDVKRIEAEAPEVYAKFLKQTDSRILRIRQKKET